MVAQRSKTLHGTYHCNFRILSVTSNILRSRSNYSFKNFKWCSIASGIHVCILISLAHISMPCHLRIGTSVKLHLLHSIRCRGQVSHEGIWRCFDVLPKIAFYFWDKAWYPILFKKIQFWILWDNFRISIFRLLSAMVLLKWSCVNAIPFVSYPPYFLPISYWRSVLNMIL